MKHRRSLPGPGWGRAARGFVALALLALPAAGCGSSATQGQHARLSVTRDFGNQAILGRTVRLGKGPTAMRVLERNLRSVQTAYSGRYVTGIGSLISLRNPPTDWIFYVNGREAQIGAADLRLRPNDVLQWDFHRWDRSVKAKQIVGAFPAPLNRAPVGVRCLAGGRSCALARGRLRAAGVRLTAGDPGDSATVVVGDWQRLRRLPGFGVLATGPQDSGVFARIHPGSIDLIGTRRSAGRLGAGSGLIAVLDTPRGERWVVTGVDASGTEAAARALTRSALANHFAVAIDHRRVLSLPLEQGRT